MSETPTGEEIRVNPGLRPCKWCGHQQRRHYPMPGCIEEGKTNTKWGLICGCRSMGPIKDQIREAEEEY